MFCRLVCARMQGAALIQVQNFYPRQKTGKVLCRHGPEHRLICQRFGRLVPINHGEAYRAGQTLC